MQSNSIIVFTKDLPALEGGGKSIRLMNWLVSLSSQYDEVYCIYFYSGSVPIRPDRLPGKVVFKPVSLIPVSAVLSFFRRCILGIGKPYSYSLFWYENINNNDVHMIRHLVRQADSILIFRLYLFPALIQFINVNPDLKKIAIDMDDAETDTFRQISDQEWQRGEYKKWIINRLGSYYLNYYEKHIPERVNTIYYSHPQDVIKYQSVYKNKKVLLHGNKAPYNSWDESWMYKDQNTILFVGSLNYYPNEDAVHYLINEIWPLILDKMSNTKLIIAGSKPGKSIRNLIGRSQSITLIENPAFIKDVFDLAAVLIVPLRAAGGTRIKVLQSFSYGVPVVSTSIGISGIEIKHGETGLIGNDASELAACCLDLLQNPARRKNITMNAHTLYTDHYSFRLV